MLSLTTTQIAARLGVSERTAYRWIERGWLKATKAPRGNKYYVEESDLDALARFEPDELTAINEKYEALEKRLASVEQELTALREWASTIQQAPARPTRPAIRSAPAAAIPFGPGEIAARTFAERHNLTREKMEGWIRRGEIETTPRAIGRDSSKTQHILTPAQQAQVIQFWEANGVEFTACPDCPHETRE